MDRLPLIRGDRHHREAGVAEERKAGQSWSAFIAPSGTGAESRASNRISTTVAFPSVRGGASTRARPTTDFSLPEW